MGPLLLGMGIALLPIYTAESGSVQIAHAILALFVGVHFTHFKWNPDWIESCLLVLVAIIFARQSFVMATGAPASVLLQPLYLFFNTLVVIAIRRVPLDDRLFRQVVKYSLAGSIIVALVALAIYGTHITVDKGIVQRSVGSFNNPNQLGYFALCVASIAALLYYREIISRWYCLALWGAAAFLVLASGSRGAVVGVLPGLLIGVAAMGRRKRLTPLAIGVFIVISGALTYFFTQGYFDNLELIRRWNAASGRYDTLGERGWGVMPGTALELLFGTGALGKELDFQLEIHSTFWSFMIDYGIFAFLLFLTVWLIWVRRVYGEFGLLGLAVIAAPATLYGLSHNGSRFTILWILIALTCNRTLERPLVRVPGRIDPRMLAAQRMALARSERGGRPYGGGFRPVPKPLGE